MFPIAIVAGVIGAVVSTAQGASWVSDHIGSSSDTASAGGKTGATSATSTASSLSPSFEAALAAQVTGQSVPSNASATTATPASAHVAQQFGTDYDALERAKAGISAYSRVGEHHSSNSPVTGS
jgi:hypothetical protein